MEQARTARIKSISFSIRTSWPEKSWIKRPWIRYSFGEIRPRKHRAGLEHRIGQKQAVIFPEKSHNRGFISRKQDAYKEQSAGIEPPRAFKQLQAGAPAHAKEGIGDLETQQEDILAPPF